MAAAASCARTRARSEGEPTSNTFKGFITRDQKLRRYFFEKTKSPDLLVSCQQALVHRALADGHREGDDRAAAERPDRDAPAHAIADEEIEEILRRFDRMAVEFQKQIAHEHASRRGGTAAGHAYDEQCFLAAVRAALILGQGDWLTGEAQVSALQAAVLEDSRRGFPCDRSGDDNPETANDGRRGDPDETTA